jgi:hypothetical protein
LGGHPARFRVSPLARYTAAASLWIGRREPQHSQAWKNFWVPLTPPWMTPKQEELRSGMTEAKQAHAVGGLDLRLVVGAHRREGLSGRGPACRVQTKVLLEGEPGEISRPAQEKT